MLPRAMLNNLVLIPDNFSEGFLIPSTSGEDSTHHASCHRNRVRRWEPRVASGERPVIESLRILEADKKPSGRWDLQFTALTTERNMLNSGKIIGVNHDESWLARLINSIKSERAPVVVALTAGSLSLATSILDVTGVGAWLPQEIKGVGLPVLVMLLATAVGFYFGKSKGN